ncbi:MAG: SGNH/GDSL hydrolase family protein [Thermoleophilia bacterium]|nr:SGNH/GDSL hydrolase family protein [Thermoleophilia bacterium]
MSRRRAIKLVVRSVLALSAVIIGAVALLAGEGLYASRRAKTRIVEPSFPARAVAGKKRTGAQVRIAFIGDSTVAGVGASHAPGWLGAQIAERVSAGIGRPVEIVGFGISGARTSDVTDVQVPKLARARGSWDLVVIVVGGNDVTHFTSYKSIGRDTPRLVAAASKAAGGVPVVFGGSARFFDAFGVPQPLRTVFDTSSTHLVRRQRKALIEGSGAKHVDVHFVDIGHDASVPHRGNLKGMSRDGFHPSDLGYGFWAQAIAPAVIDVVASTD